MRTFILIVFEILLLLILVVICLLQYNSSIIFPVLLVYFSLVISIHFWRKPIMPVVLTICTPIIILHFLGYKLYSEPIFDKNLIHMPDGHNIVNKNVPILKNHFTVKEFIAPNTIVDTNNTQHVINYIIFTKEDIKKNDSWKHLNLPPKPLNIYLLPDKHYYVAYQNITHYGCGCFGCPASFSFFSPEKRTIYGLIDISNLYGISKI